MDPRSDSGFALVVDAWFDGERTHPQVSTLEVMHGCLARVRPGDHGAELAATGWPLHRGAFLLPGLVDAHVHLFLDGKPTDPAERSQHLKKPPDSLAATARESARQALARGVTRVRDAGDRHGINHRIREEARRPGSGLAQVRSAGVGIKREKRYGSFMGTDAGEPAALARLVRELAVANDEIKLILTGIIDFDAGAVTDEPQFAVDEARLVVQTAHAHGRRVMAHCSGIKGLQVAVEAGIDCIEHGFFMEREILARMRDADLAWTPTFCPVHFQWAQPEAAGWSANTVGNLRRILDAHADMLYTAHAMGVRLLAGTDAGSMGVRHGLALADELQRFTEAGLSLEAALCAATSTPRRHFGDPHPLLAVGAPFEAVLLDQDPRRDFHALRSPRRVWAGGTARPPEAAADDAAGKRAATRA